MEGILRGKEIFNIIPFDINAPVLMYPIRHHSPVCSYHLCQVITSYKPDIVLVEGPVQANELADIMTNPDTKFPIAFYYSYKAEESHKCYYPYLESSPEYQAFAMAVECGIKAEFMDLPYGEILLHTKENEGMRQEGQNNSYNDDYLLSKSKYYKELCDKTGMRDFEEFWETYFEIKGIYMPTDEFVAQMMTYCYLTRENTTLDERIADGTMAREEFMAEHIKIAHETYDKVLVVTGGFHTPGLWDRYRGEEKVHYYTDHHIGEDEQKVYPMAYSLPAADALNGYASGMQNPGFYHKVWKRLKSSLDNGGDIEGIYRDICLETLVKAAKKASKKDLLITVSDIAGASAMGDGLSELRGKYEPGLFEMYDGARAAFVKGELNAVSALPLDILKETATGYDIGKLPLGTLKAPILNDFENQCERLGLKLRTVMANEVELEIFAKKKHREISRFFQQMDFLRTGFANRKKGPDLLHNMDRSRIRELWKYQWNVNVESSLIDQSVEGATVEEACKNVAIKRLKENMECRLAAEIYVNMFLMGLEPGMEYMELMNQAVMEDGDFFSIGKGFYYFHMLEELYRLYDQEKPQKDYEKYCFSKLLSMLPSMIQVSEDQEKDCMNICKQLYQVSFEEDFSDDRDRVRDTFVLMSQEKKKNAKVYGTVMGLLYGYEPDYQEKIQKILQGYLMGSLKSGQEGADFLTGLFFSARDILLAKEGFLELIDQMIRYFDMDNFMEILPALRLAFSYFTPMETDDIAKEVASLYGTEKQALKKELVIDEGLYLFGTKLEEQLLKEI